MTPSERVVRAAVAYVEANMEYLALVALTEPDRGHAILRRAIRTKDEFFRAVRALQQSQARKPKARRAGKR